MKLHVYLFFLKISMYLKKAVSSFHPKQKCDKNVTCVRLYVMSKDKLFQMRFIS